jgi:hypothetical protein
MPDIHSLGIARTLELSFIMSPDPAMAITLLSFDRFLELIAPLAIQGL